MSGHTNAVSLTRRLIDQYLAFGFACLFFCFAAVMLFRVRGQLETLAPLIAFVSIGILVVGAVAVFRTAKLCSAVEQQLTRISKQGANGQLPVQPISGNDPAATGWNTLIERMAEHDAWSRIEHRISEAIGESQDSSFKQLFQQLPIGVALTDSGGVVTEANRVFLSLANRESESEVLGEALPVALSLDAAPNADEVLARLAHAVNGASFDVSMGEQTEDGVLRLTRHTMAKTSGQSARDIWIVNDVTQQLLSADARNQFVYTATHELRTPLANLKAYAELLNIEDGIDVEKQKEFCNIINAEATRLARFVDDLLNISQMESGALAVHRREANFEAVVTDVMEHMQPEMDKKNLAFEVKLPAKWPRMRFDKDKVESALVNLLGNAAKYTPEGGSVTLEVNVDGGVASIHVEDTGIGISESELPMVFDTFFRSDDPLVRDVAGNGLGLSFTQEVAKLHNGRLTVTSELGKGSRFTMTLPCS